jgi:hypothetical protein
MATDEGVLGRSLGVNFARDGEGRLSAPNAEKLYTIHRFESGSTQMNLVFRDHTISDMIGFVYSGMPAQDAANHLIHNIRQAAQPVLSQGRDAVVSVILDGENAWEYYPRSGREFLRRFYDKLQSEPGIEAVTVSEAIERHRDFGRLGSLVPGSWINANFNVWIGAPEDNRSWDYLYHARTFYAEASERATEAQRKLALEELYIAEGSDWNWWYGPEHGSENRPEFDQLYRDHLMNVYRALGLVPPDALSRSILHVEHSGEIHDIPRNPIHVTLDGEVTSYFEWMGAGRYRPDPRSGAMHGAAPPVWEMFYGCDGQSVALRLDGLDKGVTVEVEFDSGIVPAEIATGRITELRAPLAGSRLRVHLSRNGLPVATLPMHGWIEVGECMALVKTQLSHANPSSS